MISIGKIKKVYWGWWIIVVSFLANFMVFGIRHGFGLFILPISQEMGWSRGEVSSVFAISMIVNGLGSIVFGRWTDKYSPHLTMSIAALIGFLGCIMAAGTQHLWQIYLTYGICFGIGMAGVFVPSTTTVRRWFVKRVGLAVGITVAAIGAGGFFFAPIAGWLINEMGWRTTFVILGIAGILTVVPSSFFVIKSSPAAVGLLPYGCEENTPYREGSAGSNSGEIFRQLRYWLISLSYGFAITGIYSISAHVAALAKDLEIGDTVGTLALSLIALSSFGGRLIMGAFSDYIGSRRALIISLSVEIVSGIAFIFVDSPAELLICSTLAGFGYGSFVPLFPVLLGELFGNKNLSFIYGIANSFSGVGGGLGALAAGLIYDFYGSYFWALIMIAVSYTVALGSFLWSSRLSMK